MELLSQNINHLVRRGIVGAYHSEVGARITSHLFFADDLLIFCNGDKRSIKNLFNYIDSFCNNSGQQINKAKCLMFVYKHMENCHKNNVLCLTRFKEGGFPNQYLGTPLFFGKPKTVYFQPLVDKVQERIHAWARIFHSMAGRITLIKLVLSAIPIHTLVVLPVPKAITNCIEKLIRGFLWDHGAVSHRHWVGWNNVCAREEDGGLGIRSLEDVLHGLHGKLAWKYLFSTSLWSVYARSRFSPAR